MKNIILGLFLFLGFIAQAQVTVASININDIEDVNYIRVQVSPRLLLNRIDVAVDYGQERGSFFGRQEVKDKEGKIIKFRSTAHVINFMDKNGWDYVNEEVIWIENGYYISYYLFKKEDTN